MQKTGETVTEQPVLATERLVLRPFTMTDAPDVQRLAGDASVADAALDIPHPFEDGMAEAWISTHAEGYAAATAAVFAITIAGTGRLCGAVGLTRESADADAELGYWIGRADWGHGYATEAAEAVVAFGFDQMRLNRIHATHLQRNPASGRVLAKLGMRRERVLPHHVRHRGQWEDLVLYAITASERPTGSPGPARQ